MAQIRRKMARISYYQADIVICIDCSFSMIPVIDSIKENLLAFIKGLDEIEGKELDWRVRIVGFRDSIVYDFPFITTTDELKEQMDRIKAQGCCENDPSPVSETVWSAVNDSEWRDCHKFVLLFTDAPAGSMPAYDIRKEREVLADQHILLFIWCKDDAAIDELNKVPRSMITRFDDPIEFYYHKTIDFGGVMRIFYPEFCDPEYPLDRDDFVL